MSKLMESDQRNTVPIAPGGRLFLSAQLNPLASLKGGGRDRHSLRAIRSRAMVEVALAWADPVWRQRWRAGSD
jgi:hypothetical protein